MHHFLGVKRVHACYALLLMSLALGCSSQSLRGPGPANPSAIGIPGHREAEMPPGANSPSNYGWGSAYDPHTPGSRGTTGRVSETGAVPPLLITPWPGRPMGVPPPVRDPNR